jgi:hypothetical protein
MSRTYDSTAIHTSPGGQQSVPYYCGDWLHSSHIDKTFLILRELHTVLVTRYSPLPMHYSS